MAYKLRPLYSSDLDRLAQIHCRAFPNATLSRLGDDILSRYYHWQLLGPHQVTALGIEDDARLVGFCLGGTFHGAYAGFVRQNRLRLIYSAFTHPGVFSIKALWGRISERVQWMFRASRHASIDPSQGAHAKDFAILAIAVDPAYARHGYGRLLMRAMEETAVEHGYSRMRLAVHPENRQALSFYLRLGWSTPPDFGPCKNVIFKELTAPAASPFPQ